MQSLRGIFPRPSKFYQKKYLLNVPLYLSDIVDIILPSYTYLVPMYEWNVCGKSIDIINYSLVLFE